MGKTERTGWVLKNPPHQDKAKTWQGGVKSKGEKALLSDRRFKSKGFLK